MSPLDNKHDLVDKTAGGLIAPAINYSMPLGSLFSHFNTNFSGSSSTQVTQKSTALTDGDVTEAMMMRTSSLQSIDLSLTKPTAGFSLLADSPTHKLAATSPVNESTCVFKKIRNTFSSSSSSSKTTTTTSNNNSITSKQATTNTSTCRSLLSLLNKETILVNSTLQASSSCSTFIDPFDLGNKLAKLASHANELAQNFFIVLLDCRSFSDFNSKRIKDSVHLNCRDKINKKRLLTQKITVKDLISSESIKSRFDMNNNAEAKSSCVSTKTSEPKKDESLIIIYDETTSDLNDLQRESNPLKIVSDNIKHAGFNNDCKILKGNSMRILSL